MQNQILGFFIVTSIALGGLCGVQWHQARQHKHVAAELRAKLEDGALEVEGLHSEVRTLKADQEQIKKAQSALGALVSTLEQATNALTRQVQAARAAAGTLQKHLELQEAENQAFMDHARNFLEADQLAALAAWRTNDVQAQRLGLELVRELKRSLE